MVNITWLAESVQTIIVTSEIVPQTSLQSISGKAFKQDNVQYFSALHVRDSEQIRHRQIAVQSTFHERNGYCR